MIGAYIAENTEKEVLHMPGGYIQTYDREAAVAYATKWAFLRNNAYYDFDRLGGDCTNFISQCLFAGGSVMNFSDNGWYYRSLNDRAPAWSGVKELYTFLCREGSSGPFALETSAFGVETGDIVQLAFSGDEYRHSLLVISADHGEILIAAHTNDSYARPLKSYFYSNARFLHILGSRTR
jgi:hypothetical protein